MFIARLRNLTLLLTAAFVVFVAACGDQNGASRDDGDAPDGAPDDTTGADVVDSDTAETGDSDADVPDSVETDADVAADADADASTPSAELERFCDGRQVAVEARIDDMLATLTLEQKASLMHGVSLIPTNGTWASTGIDELDIPGFRMLDGPRGLSRFSGKRGTAFPVAMARGATWDVELEREVGRVVGAELRLAGADVLLAPTVNILRHPRWGRAQETYGEDPLHMGLMGGAFVEGAQRHVMAVVKHYAANSIEDTRLEVDVRLDDRTLREIYLPHFRHIVKHSGVAGVMTAYNRINGDWSSESVHLVDEILRQEWAFAGFTVSDFNWGTHDTVAALTAGLDVEMQRPQVYGPALVAAVESGDAELALVDAAVRRILRAQWCFSERLEPPTLSELEGEEALELAELAATRGAVLLENRIEALPIDRDTAPTIVVIGSLADAENTGDRGSSHVNSSDVVTMIQGLQEAAGAATIVHVSGDLSDPDDRVLVEEADVVVAVVGYSETEEGEGQVAAGDRVSLALPDDDTALLVEAAALSERVVAVVIGGSAFVTDGWGDDVEAIVMAWYAGARGGAAIASLLYGEENFAGRLPISFAAAEEHLPDFDNVSLEVEYGYLHGYRLLQREQVEPLYAFGYGLSYTEFEYSELDVSGVEEVVEVTVRVTNTGDVAGIETVQVYVVAPDDVGRGPRDLRGFARVDLAPGGSEQVGIEIPLESLRRWDDDAGAWALVPAEYRIEIGSNVETIALSEVLDLR